MGGLFMTFGHLFAFNSNSKIEDNFKVKFSFIDQKWGDNIEIVIEKGVGLKIEEFKAGIEYPHYSLLGEVWKVMNTYYSDDISIRIDVESFPFIQVGYRDNQELYYYFNTLIDQDNKSEYSYSIKLKLGKYELGEYEACFSSNQFYIYFDQAFEKSD